MSVENKIHNRFAPSEKNSGNLNIYAVMVFSKLVGTPRVYSNFHSTILKDSKLAESSVASVAEQNGEELPAFVQFVFNKNDKTITDAMVLYTAEQSTPSDSLDTVDVYAVINVSETFSPKVHVSWVGQQPAGYAHHTANVKFTLGWDGKSYVQLLDVGILSLEEGFKLRSNMKSNTVNATVLRADFKAIVDFAYWSKNKFNYAGRLEQAKFWTGNTDYAKLRGVWAEAWSTLLNQLTPAQLANKEFHSPNEIDSHFQAWSKGKFNGFGSFVEAELLQGNTDTDKARGVWAEAYKTLGNLLGHTDSAANEKSEDKLAEKLHSLMQSNAALQAKNAQLNEALTASDNLLRELPDIGGFYGLAVTEANAIALEPIDENNELNNYSNELIEKCKQAINDILDSPELSGHGYANSCLEALDAIKPAQQSASSRPKV